MSTAKWHRRGLVLPGLLVGAIAGIAVLGSHESSAEDTRVGLVAQTIKVTSPAGVTVSVSEAIYSGTETLVALEPNVPGLTRFAVAPEAVHAEGVNHVPTPPSSGERGGTVGLLRFTPLSPNTQDAPRIEIERLTALVDGRTVVIEGPWSFELELPLNLAEALRMQESQYTLTFGDDIVVSVMVIRSSSETIVRHNAPTDLWEAAPPRVRVVNGDWLADDGTPSAAESGWRSTRFEPVPSDVDLRVTIGPYEAIGSSTQVVSTTIDWSQLDVGSVALSSGVRPLGEAKLDRAPDGRSILVLELEGAWPPDATRLGVVAGDGTELFLATAEVDYTKDDSGEIQGATTRLHYEVVPATADESVTIGFGEKPQFLPEQTLLVAAQP